MSFTPIRVPPGVDLRKYLEAYAFPNGSRSGFVVAGLGSLTNPKLRFAAQEAETPIPGPVELVSISGSLSEDGAHVHVTVSTSEGQVLGGHLCYGAEVRTTVELLLAPVVGFNLTRAHDPATGYKELSVQSSAPGKKGAA